MRLKDLHRPASPLGIFWGGVALALLAAWVLVCTATPAHALTQAQVRAIVEGESDARLAALQAGVATGDPALPPFLQAVLDDAVKVGPNQVIVVRDSAAVDAATGQPVASAEGFDDVVNNNRLRRELGIALAGLKLMSNQRGEREKALATLRDEVDESRLGLIDRALAREDDPALKQQLQSLRARVLVAASDPGLRLQAAQALGQNGDRATQALLTERLAQETDANVKAALAQSLKAVGGKLAWGERLAVIFSGLSLGSILLLAALGLAITYGLMGVINMAHGELIMVGAYATYLVQNVFRQWLPGAFDAYLVVAIPVSFLAAALVGAAMERLIVRRLYGRPLETLLATFGISLVLMQLVRSLFGAQNVQVENPSWMSGGWAAMPNLLLPWNRLALMAFVGLVLVGMTLLINKTRLGLFVRGVTQNRRMASCVGIHTGRVDTYAFALGSGLAGLAGCALSQVGNVGPDLGQSYIVDSFMVVVLGGVGQLAGTVWAAMGLGVLNKFLEGWTGAVLAKVAVLVVIVVFIQKRPQGLFALKGRSAEA